MLQNHVALYVRTSDRAEGSSAGAQLSQLRESVDHENSIREGQTPEFVVDQYVDLNTSALTLDRSELNRLLDDVKAGKIARVMVTRVDRLTRNARDFCKLVSAFEKHSVSFASLMERIDSTTTVGKAMLKAVQLFDEMESLDRSERIKKGKKARKAKAPSK